MSLEGISVGRYNAAVAKILAALDTNPAPNVCDQIVPVLVIEGDRAENEYVKGVRRCAGAAASPSSVGNVSLVQFFNPPGSGLLITIDGLLGAGTGSNLGGFQVVRRDPTGSQVPGLTNGQSHKTFLDGRWLIPGVTEPALQIWTDATVTVPVAQGVFRMASQSTSIGQAYEHVGITLDPGSLLITFGAVVAAIAGDTSRMVAQVTNIWTCFAIWRERALQTQELTAS